MTTIQLAGGKNRQQKREKQKSKKSKSGKYTQKHVRVQQAMVERRQQLGIKQTQKNKSPSQNKNKSKKNKKKQKGGSDKLERCGPGSTFNPKECCLPGIPCYYPCYQEDYDDEINRCVNEQGNPTNLREIMELTQCDRGVYNPEECCESTEYGPACFAPCYDGENCYNFSGETPLKKIYKRERAKSLIQKLVNQKAGAYEKIYNPSTGRWVLSSGKLGKNILQQYLSYV